MATASSKHWYQLSSSEPVSPTTYPIQAAVANIHDPPLNLTTPLASSILINKARCTSPPHPTTGIPTKSKTQNSATPTQYPTNRPQSHPPIKPCPSPPNNPQPSTATTSYAPHTYPTAKPPDQPAPCSPRHPPGSQPTAPVTVVVVSYPARALNPWLPRVGIGLYCLSPLP